MVVFPHYKISQKDEVQEFKNKVAYPVIEITDNQMVVILGKKVEKVGRF